MSDVQIGGQHPDNLFRSARKAPATCHECVHYNFNTCGRCGARARKAKEKVEDRLEQARFTTN